MEVGGTEVEVLKTLQGTMLVRVNVTSIRRPAMVQDRSWRKANIVRIMQAMFPSRTTGLEANRHHLNRA